MGRPAERLYSAAHKDLTSNSILKSWLSRFTAPKREMCDAKYIRKFTLKLQCMKVKSHLNVNCVTVNSWPGQKPNMHIDAVHEGKKRFDCKDCGVKFTQKKSIKIHVPHCKGKQDHMCPYVSIAGCIGARIYLFIFICLHI